MNSGMMVMGPSNDEYETPPWLFDALDTEFKFDFDAAARGNDKEVVHKVGSENQILKLVGSNAKCGLWTDNIERDIDLIRRTHTYKVWCNPPYTLIDTFTELALASPNFWCFLLPARTGTDWYHRLHGHKRVEMRPFRRRIQFLLNGQPPLGKDGKPQGPRFDSLVALIRSSR